MFSSREYNKKYNLENIEEKINELMLKEDRKDAEFRMSIVSSELGDIAKYITHDPDLNPNARPHGDKKDEILAYGQAIIQLIALSNIRKIRLEEAIDRGLKNWIDADWRKCVAQGEGIEEIIACPGHVSGIAYVALNKQELEDLPSNHILVTPYATSDIVNYFDKVKGIITDHGGCTSHMATLSREHTITCIVGSGNATEKIKSGQNIDMNCLNEDGYTASIGKKGKITFL